MRHRSVVAVCALTLAVLLGPAGAVALAAPPPGVGAPPGWANAPHPPQGTPGPPPGHRGRGHRHADCARPNPYGVHCDADVATEATGAPAATGSPSPGSYGPADVRSAYKLAASAGAGSTVAIVDALDDPKAEADLGVYRAQYGQPACTTANGCFHKVDQNGGTRYPTADQGWAQEISLDLDAVSAACPSCKILLVEAASTNFTDLGAAENRAAALHATSISNSFGGSEFSSEPTFDSQYFNHPGIPMTVSAGDDGYGVEYPAASRNVTAVGGTSLTHATNARGWSESTWNGTGSGCSAYEPKPSWQADKGCARRTVADVAADADPSTGLAVYDSYAPAGGASGWMVFGGTSAAAPLVASMYAMAGNASSISNAAYPYAHRTSLFDVTTGANGSCGSYLCTGAAGYDGPTGLGTPNGTTGF